MKIIDFKQIQQLNISPSICNKWVTDAFLHKYDALLPPKISTKPEDGIFFNTMPCLLPFEHRFGVKEVTRFHNRKPALQSDILLYDSDNGDLLALMDGTWITTYRTGAVAALAIKTLQKTNASVYSFIGLGNTAIATLLCLLSYCDDKQIHVKLMKHKEQEKEFANRFKNFTNVSFEYVESDVDFMKNTDVVVSCITYADKLIIENNGLFEEGVLLVPVHTQGFQNCDLFFDKIIADDTGHVQGFKYFDKFKQFNELSEILLKRVSGRESNKERIIAYNVGIALHDVYFASRIYDMLNDNSPIVDFPNVTNDKIWV